MQNRTEVVCVRGPSCAVAVSQKSTPEGELSVSLLLRVNPQHTQEHVLSQEEERENRADSHRASSSCCVPLQLSNNMESSSSKRSMNFTMVSLVVNVALSVALSVALVLLAKNVYSESFPSRGLISIRGSTVEWIHICPTDKYTPSLSDMDTAIGSFGAVQVRDEVWLCGGLATRQDDRYDQSRSCQILSLADGQWSQFAHRMDQPRINPVMLADGGKVLVISGTTSDVNSRTGCRDTQEVFDTDNLALDWTVQLIEEREICMGGAGQSSHFVSVDC